MAGYRDCIEGLARAAGRALKDDEILAIYERVHKAARDIKAGRVEAGATGVSGKLAKELGTGASVTEDLVVAAARKAAADMQAEAAKAEHQGYLQLAKLAARQGDAVAVEGAGFRPLDAVSMLLARDYTGKVNVTSLEQQVQGYESALLRKLSDSWDALGKDYMGFFQDRAKLLDLVREIRGEDTGNPLAKKGAKAWRDTADEARQTFNRHGGDIGQLDDWGMPQHHSQARVARAGREAWIDQILPLLARDRYVNALDGTPWNDAQLREFLGHAWNTIATDGNINVEPGKFKGTGKRANRHAESRQIHFKDAESVIAYWEAYGERTAVEIMTGHVKTLARDIAFIERFGPNPNLTYQTLRDQALVKEAEHLMNSGKAADRVAAGEKLRADATKLDNLYNYGAGITKPVYRPWLKSVADGVANANVFGKLGSASITSLFGDKVMMEAVAHMNNLPAYQRWRNELSLFNPANATDRRFLNRQGLMLDSVRSGLSRFGDDLSQNGLTGRTANAVMRLTGMQAVNDLRKGAFGLSLMDAIGHEVQRGAKFSDLAQSDIRTLRNYGITETDWATWQLAKPDDMGGNHTVLTPDAIARIPDDALRKAGIIGAADGAEVAEIARQAAIVKLLGAVNTESEFAIVTPGWRERALFQGNVQRGTVPGEIQRAVLQFKSFPWAFMQRAMDAVANQEGASSKTAMAGYILMATTLMGAMIIQTKDMLAGKDPRKMADENWYKFWGAAMISGGALGFYGDFLYSITQTRYGTGPAEALAGPTVGPMLNLIVHPLQALKASIEGKETHLAAQMVQQAKSFVPFNNAWYAKAAIDHLVWNRVMDALSPGYLNSIRRKTAKEFGQDWWWDPGDRAPERAPDLSQALAR